jgi:hypothetical protein
MLRGDSGRPPARLGKRTVSGWTATTTGDDPATFTLGTGETVTLHLTAEAHGSARAEAVPAPATLLLVGAALSGLAARRLRARQ